ncbi:uncharacterized protein LOC143290168 [Babylonia areolata]|uniref:uncharacterized protein LOC143290168 n=1 Tax=Babylonia areolata TaxID=304850 RepID=UPI003FD130C2
MPTREREEMLIMDSASSDHSPPLSENAASSWLHWENEISSISGLNLDSTSELSGLVEDKEIAARAVAFVVNSTRKGIVPLCADIANLLRAKRSLEKKVFLLKRENEALRGSTGHSFRTSHSTSPTPPSFSSGQDKSPLHDQGSALQERSRPCSRCSQCSSTVSNSPQLEKTYSFTKTHLHSHPDAHLPPPATTTTTNTSSPSTRNHQRRSPRVPRRPPNGLTTQAIVHCLADPSTLQDSGYDVSRTRTNRKGSLPEIISEPDGQVLRVSPTISKETQCSLLRHGDSPGEEQFMETVRLNSKLAEELGSARKEIEILKGRLKELEMNQLARECWREQYHVDTECEEGGLDERPLPPLDPPYSVIVKRHYSLNGSSRSRLHCQFAPVPGSVLYAEPLYGCKCTACEEAMGGEIHASLAHTLNQDLPRFPVNSKLQVQLGDHVVIKGERTGRIRYIGHLDKIGQPNMVFVGIELDAPVGRHDGFFNGKRYFFCTKDHGVILPLHDIVCKVQPKKSNSMEESSVRDKLDKLSLKEERSRDCPSHAKTSFTSSKNNSKTELKASKKSDTTPSSSSSKSVAPSLASGHSEGEREKSRESLPMTTISSGKERVSTKVTLDQAV